MEAHEVGTAAAVSKTRLEFLVDGIFAIAMTILVLELKVPELSDRHSVSEMARELGRHASVFGSYLLSFLVLGMFWYRHNQMFRYFQHITKGMLAFQLLQLAMAAFFPFCAALLGRYPTNYLTTVVYFGCFTLYLWSVLLQWVLAKRAGALTEQVTGAEYARRRNRNLRGCILITAFFVVYLVTVIAG
jgi:uncharacterized membrane protein